MKKRTKVILSVCLVLLLITGVSAYAYESNYYHAGETALAVMVYQTTIQVQIDQDGDVIWFIPKDPTAELIFYPGGKMAHTAYASPLGGAMAASYAAEHVDEPDGLVLLAAYFTQNLVNSGLDVLSVYDSEGGVLDMEKYEQCRSNLPLGTSEVVIDGGCHAQFGSYGPQHGDGIPTISGAAITTFAAQ